MKKLSARLALTLLLLVGVGACARTAPIYNVASDTFATASAPLGERATQIKRAGVGLGWAMEDAGPGKVKGTLNLRGHQAVILVSFNQATFAIQYVSSIDLDYDGTNIHKNYNGWVQRLQQAIKVQSSVG